jgi:uncharacterized repeat protein (TIGR03803 family)
VVDVLHSFGNGTDGSEPYAAALTNVVGTLYGTTWQGGGYGGGTVFSIDPSTGAEIILHSFGSGADGAKPYAELINVNGTLYGTTWQGGTYGGGTVFSLGTAGARTAVTANSTKATGAIKLIRKNATSPLQTAF